MDNNSTDELDRIIFVSIGSVSELDIDIIQFLY